MSFIEWSARPWDARGLIIRQSGRNIMRKTALVIGLLAAAAAWLCADAATVNYKANLAGTAEVPPVTTGGKGTAAVNVDIATKQVSWRGGGSPPRRPPAPPHPHRAAAPR